jgi:hypothetical protein
MRSSRRGRSIGRIQLIDPLERERRLRERPDRQSKQHQRMVIPGSAVQMELGTSDASVDEDPFTISANGDRDRFHERAAARGPIAGTIAVQVTAPQARGAVVPVSRSRCETRDVGSAVPASEPALPFNHGWTSSAGHRRTSWSPVGYAAVPGRFGADQLQQKRPEPGRDAMTTVRTVIDHHLLAAGPRLVARSGP